MSLEFEKYDSIYTQDGVHLGDAIAIYQRTTDVNPDLLYYENYLHVASLEAGNQYYIPVEFVAGRDASSGHITLSAKLETIKNNTWDRMPDFVAFHRGNRMELATEHPWI